MISKLPNTLKSQDATVQAVETQGLGKRFRSHWAVRGLDTVIPVGSIVGLLGATGAGKTTLLRLIAGALSPTRGRLHIMGTPVGRLSLEEKARVAYVDADIAPYKDLSLHRIQSYFRALYPRWDDEFAAELTRTFDLPTKSPLKHLSRGMAIKARLSLALASRPNLLLLDEPFSGLDSATRDDLAAGILRLSQESQWTILIASHEAFDLEPLIDRVLIMSHGRLVVDENFDQLLSRFRTVDLIQEGPAVPVSRPPEGVLGHELAARTLRIVDARWNDDDRLDALRAWMPATVKSQVRPMSLRQIATTLIRSTQATGRGGATE